MKGILDFFGLKYYDTKIKLYISKLLSGLKSVSIQLVDTVPSPVDALDNVIYFVPNNQTSDNNIFDEYVKINGQIECIGTTACDLSNFQINKNGLVPAPSKTGMLLLSSGHWVYPGSINGQSILNDITIQTYSPNNIISPGLKVNGALIEMSRVFFADTNIFTNWYLGAVERPGLNALMSTGYFPDQSSYLTIPILSNPSMFPEAYVDTYVYTLYDDLPLIFDFPLFSDGSVNGRLPFHQETLSLFPGLTHLFIYSDNGSLSFNFQLMANLYEITIRVHYFDIVDCCRKTRVYIPSENQEMFTLDNSSNCEMHINRTYDIYEESGDILIYGGLDIFIS
ncbi:MAG: hypothetical protein J6A44_03265 [Paludibacteraceae bacterium]|nr:hypothetical protein [Paludibacteraceae bacterium]